jgi:acyl-coenzyme A synthetase/AMP-(fatty) acid ligase
MNIVDPILFQCRINADQPAICVPGTRFDVVTYAQLEYMINNLTRAVLPLGFQPGQVVALLVQNKVLHVAFMLALMRVGVVTVGCQADAIPAELRVAAVITDRSETAPGIKRLIQVNADWVKGSGERVVDPRLYSATGDEVCRIILTSGSTGVPKGIAFSHHALFRWDRQLQYGYGDRWPQSLRLYCDLGLNSTPTLRYLLHILMRGGMIMFHGDDALGTEQSLALFKIQNMATTPRGLTEHIKFYEHTGLRCGLDHILVVGGNLSKTLAERARETMCPHLISYYGATEVGSVATADAKDVVSIPGAAGYILPDASVDIVDETGNSLGPDQEGIVRIRTPYIASGYVGHPEASARAFRDGCFYPGDFGYVTGNGLFVVTGRAETRINVGGDKINPETVEDVVMKFPGINDAAVLTLSNNFGLEDIYALIQADSTADIGSLRAHCQAKLPRDFVPVRFLVVDRIPRSESGKIERGRLADLAKTKLA